MRVVELQIIALLFANVGVVATATLHMTDDLGWAFLGGFALICALYAAGGALGSELGVERVQSHFRVGGEE